MKKEITKINVAKTYIKAYSLLGAIATMSTTAFAENTIVKNGAQWILDGLMWIVIVGGLIGVGMAAIKRNVTMAIIILIATAVVAVLCANPQIIISIGNTIKDILGV